MLYRQKCHPSFKCMPSPLPILDSEARRKRGWKFGVSVQAPLPLTEHHRAGQEVISSTGSGSLNVPPGQVRNNSFRECSSAL